MPHTKCVACKTRLFRAPGPTDEIGDLCPGCGGLLEPVDSLAEIVGFRSIRRLEAGGDGDGAATRSHLADRVYDLLGHREARLMQAQIDVQVEDDRRLGAGAVAQAGVQPAWDGQA